MPRRLIVLLLAVLLSGCGNTAVVVPVPRPDPATTRLCTALRGRLPAKLHGLKQRESRPKSPLVVAWGSPTIVLRCGVARPPTLLADSELVDVDGVSWFPEPADRPVKFTAVGRQAYVEMTIPLKYAPPGEVLVDLAGPLKATVPVKPDGTP